MKTILLLAAISAAVLIIDLAMFRDAEVALAACVGLVTAATAFHVARSPKGPTA